MMLRKLKTDDIFPMFQILNKIGFKNLKEKLNVDIARAFVESKKNEEQDEESKQKATASLGFDIVMEIASLVFEGLPRAKNEIYAFLSSISGLSEEEISELPPADFMEMVVEWLQKEEFRDFFKVVSKLFK